jgi:hypothetical protein
MTTGRGARRARLSIDVEPELRRKIKVISAQKDLSVRDYIVSILRRALEEEAAAPAPAEASGWAQLSTRSFARDWESEEDSAYDRPS